MSPFGTEKNFGISDSLLDAVRGVVQNKEQEEDQVIDQTVEELEENLDKDFFHTSVERGKFMKHKHGGTRDPNTMYLHDLDNKNKQGEPMLVTFDPRRQSDAEKIAKKFGGKVFKTRFGTFRIIKEEVELEEKLDPVNPKAVKKDFDDRKDKDIDNDGDVDSSDEYLHKRRKAISKSMSKEKKTEVDTDPKLDEAKKMMEAMRVLATKGKYKVVTKGDGVARVMYGAKEVGSGDLDDGAGGWFMSVPGEKGQKFFDSPNKIADYFEKKKITKGN